MKLKNEIDTTRMASDTAWEIIVGNTQVMFDLWQWQKWQDLATSSNIKHLKLVGVLITFVHQASGYYYYNEWTELLNSPELPKDPDLKNRQQPRVSSLNDIADLKKTYGGESKDQHWQPVLVPVYMP